MTFEDGKTYTLKVVNWDYAEEKPLFDKDEIVQGIYCRHHMSNYPTFEVKRNDMIWYLELRAGSKCEVELVTEESVSMTFKDKPTFKYQFPILRKKLGNPKRIVLEWD